MKTSFISTTFPDDYHQNIRRMKQAMRNQIGDIESLFTQVCDKIEKELATAREDVKNTGSAWPEIQWRDLVEDRITAETIQKIKRRGCLVVRQNFPRDTAIAWDKSMLNYLKLNNFDGIYQSEGDSYFGNLEASRPEIYPIYWSQAQMQARQSEEIAQVQSFLNRLWKFESTGKRWFEPDISIIYPDRIRRRPPGTTSTGLGAHTDSGALERWLHPAYQKVFQNIFNNRFAEYDPWDAAYRPDINEYQLDNVTRCSVFRTFQGWTALSDMALNQGLLHVVPIPEAMAYLLLRPLLNDVSDDELCGVTPGKALPASEKWHPHLMHGLCSIPPLQAGDSVWWHCDLIHSVAPVENQQGWGNVMYIPAAPLCDRNLAYAHKVVEALENGTSPADFPREDYEKEWRKRFTPADLNTIGLRGLGLN
ncbi:DUF1479 domain-containing protein [Xenorhabdus hominickii]|uniref:DUF1479 domain-containing protein n=1 Tax=Xenorhabdus hominickii TaxID=351679 RepID=A0A2G0Q4L9_XENHO|nr:DUF1479 domain-containing protein [Xenorhabdus hominickii]AOM42454.1 hypothetical protein A9255_18985 [Xenorhabdus hominickii]PHM54131.1 hypothetical protein Xhom_03205 [Xenorhabdus hominickii]